MDQAPFNERSYLAQELLKVCQKMSSERDLGALLDLIANEATKLMRADRASIFLLDREKGQIWSKVALGSHEILRCDARAGIAGAVALTGQAMATTLNIYLSDTCDPAWTWPNLVDPPSFTPEGFGGFELGETVCTRRSGPDKVLGNGDDGCQAFVYPTCITDADATVADVRAAANQALGGESNSLGCTFTELNNALNNINVQFDQCAEVIECDGVTTTPGACL